MKKLLIVVDYQKDFVDGSLGFSGAELLDGPIAAKIAAYRAAGDDVVFTLDTHGPDYPATQEGRRLPVPHCIKGTPGWELADAFKELAGTRFEKGTFGSRELAEYVRDGGFSQAEVVGLCTDICVISNALLIKAFCPELPVSVDASCCAGVSPESHENALKAMEMCQIDVVRKE